MQILILNWRDSTHPQAGGAEGYLLQIARCWVSAGHSVHWLCGRHPSQPAEDEKDGIRIHRQGGHYGVFAAAAVQYLKRFRGRVDIVIDAENGIPFFSPFYSRAPKIVLVHHIHREVFARELPRPLAQLGTLLEARLMPWIYRRDWFVAVSHSTRSELLDLGVSPQRQAIIHNGLDHSLYRPGTKAARPTVVWLGRLREYKDANTLVEAAAALIHRHPNIHLVIAGDGPNRDNLQKRIEDLGLSEAIEIRGFVKRSEKIRLLQQAHVVVQTSMKEGWGMTVMEANACGTVVVASNVPGLRDSVRDSETGILVPWRRPDALADAVSHLLQNRAMRRNYERAALQWASRFDWSVSAQRWLELLAARQQHPDGLIPEALRFDELHVDGLSSNGPKAEDLSPRPMSATAIH